MISKKTLKIDDVDFQNGEIILVDKEKGKSSFNVVYKIRKAAGVKKVGHAGTLDPAATGLLIVCTGKKTKDISLFQEQRKVYSGVFCLGKRTLSMDSETDFIEEKEFYHITEDEINQAAESFVGKLMQIPPMYSAVKHRGKALYKYARKGVEVERKPREVNIYRFEIREIELPFVHFEIECSKGTYIRAIAEDLGIKLGCGAYLKELRRTRIGDFSVDDAIKIQDFQALCERNFA